MIYLICHKKNDPGTRCTVLKFDDREAAYPIYQKFLNDPDYDVVELAEVLTSVVSK